MLERSHSTAEMLVANAGNLISLPEICLRLKQVLDDSDHHREDVVEVICCDPSLCARILRIVNSAYYGFSRQIGDISQALSIIGEYELRNLVLITSVVKTLENVANEQIDIEAFWQQSLMRGILARKIAEICQPGVKEQLFIGGLLQDIGQLILYYQYPDLFVEVREMAASEDRPKHLIEQDLLGYDHARVGGLMAEMWKFPPALVSIIAHHHDQGDVGHESAGNQVRLASHLAENDPDLGGLTELDGLQQLDCWRWANERGLGEPDLAKLKEDGANQFQAIREIFFGGD